MKVRAKFYGDAWAPGILKSMNADQTYNVNFLEYPTMVFSDPKVPIENIRLEHSLKLVPTVASLLPKQFYPVEFVWTDATEGLDITLNLWRE
eukprot:gene9726-40801_t